MKDILCFGDSNTYGYIPETKGRYMYEERWTGILANKMFQSEYHIIEEGLCGRTTIFEDELRPGRRGADVLPILLESHSPLEWVVLMLGTNDCKIAYHASAEKIGTGIECLLDQILKADKEIKILLISPIRLGDGVWEDGFDPEFDEISVRTSKELKKIYMTIAEKYHCWFLAASDMITASEADREHFSRESHRFLADAVYEIIMENS